MAEFKAVGPNWAEFPLVATTRQKAETEAGKKRPGWRVEEVVDPPPSIWDDEDWDGYAQVCGD